MRRRQRGVVLVIALAILAGLVAIVASVVTSQSMALKAEQNRINSRRARVAAEAGIQRALAALSATIQDTSGAAGTAATGTTVAGQAQLQTDEWYTLGNKGNEQFTVGNATFRMEIVDAGAFVNINTAPQDQLLTMPLSQQQVDAILDWRENGLTARVEGAKDEFYNALTKPYNAKLRRLDSVDELLDVRYMTPQDLYFVNQNQVGTVTLPALADGREPTLYDLFTVDSFAQNLRPDGTALVNVNVANAQNTLTQAGLTQADAQSIAAGGTAYASIGDVIARVSQPSYATVLDVCTTSAANRVEGKINLNTASEAVLMTIPNFTQDLAQAIVAYQSTGFTRLSDLLQVSGFNTQNNLQQFAGYFTVRSSVFLVRVVGEASDSRVVLEAVVDTSSGTPRIIKMHDQPFSDMPTRWGWSTEPTTETTILEAN